MDLVLTLFSSLQLRNYHYFFLTSNVKWKYVWGRCTMVQISLIKMSCLTVIFHKIPSRSHSMCMNTFNNKKCYVLEKTKKKKRITILPNPLCSICELLLFFVRPSLREIPYSYEATLMFMLYLILSWTWISFCPLWPRQLIFGQLRYTSDTAFISS